MEQSKVNKLALAISIAAKAHEPQEDKGGNAYILHPIRIMMRLRTDDQELMIIAILHDVIEDTYITLDMLKTMGFSNRVLHALWHLTHQKEEPYQDYIERIALNVDAILIKLGDLKDNSDITRLKGLRPKDHERIAKYNTAYYFLKEALEKLNAKS